MNYQLSCACGFETNSMGTLQSHRTSSCKAAPAPAVTPEYERERRHGDLLDRLLAVELELADTPYGEQCLRTKIQAKIMVLKLAVDASEKRL